MDIVRRVWAMPNANTFQIPPINQVIQSAFNSFDTCVACDPFVRNSPFKSRCKYQNDIDPAIDCDSHLDALVFLESIADCECDLVLFDPPYSPRQVSECYKKHGLTVNMQTTQASYWALLKEQIARIAKPGGAVITCGWNSGGIGETLGFDREQTLLVAHGGWHNDTIVTLEP